MASTPPSSSQPEKPFDYIIVGGGTAGLVVASRLSEDADVRVLVIEAGADKSADPLILTPGLVAAVYGKDEYDWNFISPPQPHLHNRRIGQPRGKMLGGSSALNFLILLYPSKNIIDAWAALGNPGWDHDSLAPYFRKFATVHAPSQSARDIVGLTYHHDEVASGDGHVQVSFSEGYGPNNKAWLDTFAGLGLEADTDHRHGKAVGAFQNPATIDPATKTRSLPPLPTTTRMWLNALTSSYLPRHWGGGYHQGWDNKTDIGQRRGDILAAGALQSPQILELSGVGNKDLLEKHGIPVVVDNPNVGEGMQDHAIVMQSFEVADGVLSGDILRDPNVVNMLIGLYQTGGAGPLGQSNITVAYAPLVDKSGIVETPAKKALFASHESNLSLPGHQLVRSPLESDDGTAFQYLLFPIQTHAPPSPRSMQELITPTDPDNFLTIMTILNHPFSRGSVHITSPAITTKPQWDPQYNTNPLDLDILAPGVSFVERIVDPATPFGKLLKTGGRRLPQIVGHDLDKAKEIVRQRQISVFHVSGSCAMMPREKGGVVDERLKVYGVGRLRVVDASVFPLEPSGNLQSTVYAVAERAADIIRGERAERARVEVEVV